MERSRNRYASRVGFLIWRATIENTVEIARLALFSRPGIATRPLMVYCRTKKLATSMAHVPEVVVGRYSAQIDYMLDNVQPHLLAGENCLPFSIPGGGGWFEFTRGKLSSRGIETLRVD